MYIYFKSPRTVVESNGLSIFISFTKTKGFQVSPNNANSFRKITHLMKLRAVHADLLSLVKCRT